jgi:hypothetical protein
MGWDDGYRRRLSWREIDKLKDKSGFSKIRKKYEKEQSSYLKEDPKAKAKYLKEIEKLFVDKEELEKQELLEELHKSYGTKNFKKLAKEFIKKFGFPEDWRILLLFLDLEDKKLVLTALEKLKNDFPNRSLNEKQNIVSKLKVLALSPKDEEIAFKVDKILRELNF